MTDSEKSGTSSETRILVIDDDKGSAEFIAEFLSVAGFAVSVCTSGTSALDFVKRQAVDLVLLDIMMPDMNGFEIARAMKEFFGKNTFVPIIFLSARTHAMDIVNGIALGARHYVQKPFRIADLVDKVARTVKGK